MLLSCPAAPERIVAWLHVAASQLGVQQSRRRRSLSVTSAASGSTPARRSTVGSLSFSRPVFFFLSLFLNPRIRSRPSRVLRAVKGPFSVCASSSPANSPLPGESLPGGVFRGPTLGPQVGPQRAIDGPRTAALPPTYLLLFILQAASQTSD